MKNNRKPICIFGAHSRAQTLCEYLTRLDPACRIAAYLVDNDEENPASINGVPVKQLSEWEAACRRAGTACPQAGAAATAPGACDSLASDTVGQGADTVYIATRGLYHEKITARLREAGFRKIIPVTPALDMELRNRYMALVFEAEGKPYEKLEAQTDAEVGMTAGSTLQDACIYVAKSVFDAPLAQSYTLASYEKILQVGAALTAERLQEAAYRDDDTECGAKSAESDAHETDATEDPGQKLPLHISDRNRQFCELTGLYWIWQHATQKIAGLAHYRRHFLLPADWLRRMEEERIDVILPVPLYVAPSLADNYRQRHSAADWDTLTAFLHAYDPAHEKAAEAFFSKGIYSPCNMFIMRKEILDAYCRWVFPILFAMEKQIGQKEDVYQNRYPGFMSERLLSFFFDMHRDRYHVVYADKNFLG